MRKGTASVCRFLVVVALFGMTLAIGAGSLSATGTTTEGLTWIESGGDVTITRCAAGGSCNVGALVIPAEINGKPVTTIDNYAFSGINITSITFPASITTLGNAIFEGSGNLTRVTFASPSNLRTLGQYVFQNALENDPDTPIPLIVESVVLPEGLVTIEESALRGLTRLTSVHVPSSVTEIGDSAFRSSGLTSITFPSDSRLTTIGDFAFVETNLTSISFPASITALGSRIFQDAGNLTHVAFVSPSALRTISSAFELASSLESIVLPEGLETIGNSAFSSLSRLTSVHVPSSVTEIGSRAFIESGLTSITFPNNSELTTIGDFAFIGTNLTSITFPASIETVGNVIFEDADNLTHVAFAGPSAFTTLHAGVFAYAYAVQSIVLPEGLEVIEDGPLVGGIEPSQLTSIHIPSSVTTVGLNAFSGLAPNALIDFEGNYPSIETSLPWKGGDASDTQRVRFQPTTTGWPDPPGEIAGFATAYYLAAPRAPVAVAGIGSATITVAARATGPTWSRITVTASPGGATCTVSGASGSCTVAGLTPGTVYTFTATAAIDSPALISAASPISNAVTPGAPDPDPVPTTESPNAPAPFAPRSKVKGSAIVTTNVFSGPGRIVQNGKVLIRGRVTACRARRTIPAAGKHSISCRLTAKTKQLLRRQSLRVRITTTFTSQDGEPQTVSRIVRLRRSN